MNTTIKIEEVKKDHYKLSIKTYKSQIEGIFERSELRHIIQTIDNVI